MNPVDIAGYEQHPLLHQHVRDIASRGVGELMAVVHELGSGGGVVRIAHIRAANGIEWTTAVGNIRTADPPA